MTIIKTIKFDLPIDGVKVKNIEELREHFTVEILELYNNGILLKWLKSRRNLEEASRLETIHETQLSRSSLLKTLCEIFTVDADDMIISSALGMPPEKMEKNFPEIKAQYRAIAKAEVEAEAKVNVEKIRQPTVSGKYLIHANRTVTDTETQLMWKQNSEAVKYTWDDAMAKFGNNVHFAGYNDWRMPTIEELKTLFDEKNSPVINPIAFPNTPSSAFWSISPVANLLKYVWVFNFGSGGSNYGDKNSSHTVRLVRNGQ